MNTAYVIFRITPDDDGATIETLNIYNDLDNLIKDHLPDLSAADRDTCRKALELGKRYIYRPDLDKPHLSIMAAEFRE